LERAAPNAADLEQSFEDLEQNLKKSPDMGGAAEHLERALAKFLAKLQTLSAAQRDQLLDGLDGDIVGGLPREFGQLATALRAEPFGLNDLPKPLLERWISADGREVVQVTPREDVSNNAAAERFVDSVRQVVPSATGVPVVYLEASRTVVHAFLLAFAYALVMITVLLWIFLRNGKDLLLVIVPILLATGATVGITVLFGIPLNFASVIGLPLLVGMNVDNSVHILHRVRTEPGEDGEAFGTSTSLAILSSNLTTIVSFGTLALSPHRGMASLGQMLTLGLILTLGASMVLLPALLKLKAFRGPGFAGEDGGFGEAAQSDADA
ncbi:MAG TPA: MMPL family transporter, partial [Gammaproteobacteria bacterium]|nr:MMPL family transporter [Gammaproteobacteria bacterium]